MIACTIFMLACMHIGILLCMTQEKGPHHTVRSPRARVMGKGHAVGSVPGAHTVHLVTFRFKHVIKPDYHKILIGKLKYVFINVSEYFKKAIDSVLQAFV
jgi:hypothetical protein